MGCIPINERSEHTLWWIMWNQPYLANVLASWLTLLKKKVDDSEVNDSENVSDCGFKEKPGGSALFRSNWFVDSRVIQI